MAWDNPTCPHSNIPCECGTMCAVNAIAPCEEKRVINTLFDAKKEYVTNRTQENLRNLLIAKQEATRQIIGGA